MAFNDDFTLIDLEQINISREYQDQHAGGPENEGSGVCDFNDNFNRTLSALRRLLHGPGSGLVNNWFDTPSIGLSGLHQDVIDIAADLENILMSSGNNWTVVFQTGSGILDMPLAGFDADVRIGDGQVWEFNDENGANPIMEITNSGVIIRNLGHRPILRFTSTFDPGDTVSVPGGFTYTPESDPAGDDYRNLYVTFNGQRMLPGSGVDSGDEQRRDYQEIAGGASIITNRRLQASIARPSRIEFEIRG